MPSPFKVTSHISFLSIRTGKFKVTATRSIIADDLKSLSEISKSQMWVFVSNRFKIKEFMDSELHMIV